MRRRVAVAAVAWAACTKRESDSQTVRPSDCPTEMGTQRWVPISFLAGRMAPKS